MAWAAYRVTKPNGEVVPIIIGILPKNYVLKREYRSTDELLATGFPIELTGFALNQGNGLSRFRAYGFGNAIAVGGVADGETWKLDNGSSIIFRDKSTSSRVQITVTYRNPDGSVFFVSPNGDTLWPVYDDEPRMVLTPFLIQNEDGSFGEGCASNSPHIDNYGRCNVGSGVTPDYYFPRYQSTTLKFFAGAKPIYTPKDPYEEGGESGTGGGTGSFSGTGDSIGIPSLPTLSATDAGFITLFNPTLGEMHSLASYMWSDLFDVNGWKKIFADPMGAILGLSIVPVNVPSGGAKEVSVGNISTGVSMTVAASQYVEVDCGTLNVEEYWGAYLDYDPYTKAEIYLPYIGIHPIATDDIMNKSVHVVYHVDILSGSCCAYVQCGGTVLYSFIGQCSSSIPITGDNWTNVINGAISIAGSIGTMVATGGASAPMAIGQIASTAVNTMKPSVEKSGAMGGTGGMLGVQTPYLILTRPRQALPRLQNTFTGYPAFINELLGDLEGYTEVESIHLENVPATESELSEIENLLKGGVIF